MSKQPTYYAILTADVRYNNNLSSSEKLFYAEITALTNKNGKCWASNSYFAELYGVSNSTITSWVNALKDESLIDVEYQRNGKEVKKRIITIIGGQNSEQGYSENTRGGSQKIEGGYSENLKENNTSNNTTSTNSENTPSHIPTLQEVKDYFTENGYDPKVAEKAYRIYNASVEDHPRRQYWRDSRDNKIKNWKLKMQSVWFKPENEITQNTKPKMQLI